MSQRQTYKVHADVAKGLRPQSICGAQNARRFTQDDGDVTCNVCLYLLGLYMPLSKLREHQLFQRYAADGNYREQLKNAQYTRAFK